MPLPPFPVLPVPRTWSRGDKPLTGLLRNDLANAALLLANRPLFIGGQYTTGQGITTGAGSFQAVSLDTERADPWLKHILPNAFYPVPLGGWYLAEGDTGIAPGSVGSYASQAIRVTQNNTSTTIQGGAQPTNGANWTQPNGAVLAQLDPTTSDQCQLMIAQNNGSTLNVQQARFKAEWVAQPTTLGYGTGTVVTSPQPAQLWALGPGTSITNAGGIAAGATSITVSNATGVVVGGYLGLDYFEGQPVSPMAEVVQVTSVTGLTIGITATTYPHGGSLSPGLVAVPVSAAWMNQQVRDMIRFLCYPPIAAFYGGTAALGAQTFPAATVITFGTSVVDNFTGWNPSAHSQYFFPVGGVYQVYGQVAGSPVSAGDTLCAGIAINGGTIQWGGSVKNPSGSVTMPLCATVTRLMRVNAGQYVSLFGSSASGCSLGTFLGYGCRMIVVFRGF